MDTILSKAGNELEEVNTPWGRYYAVAFKEASGKQISEIPFTDELIFGWGKALGKLHKLSSVSLVWDGYSTSNRQYDG